MSIRNPLGSEPRPGYRFATLAGGCFWCLEAVYEDVAGVADVESGYAGGAASTPTYRAVCSGSTGHAEVVRIEFDPERISYRELLEIFFAIHDPTTLNRQGNDVGTQYRSAIFFHDEAQRTTAEQVIAELRASLRSPVVTELLPVSDYHRAETEHQEYFRQHPGQGYCAFVVAPKVEKFRRTFAAKRRPATA